MAVAVGIAENKKNMELAADDCASIAEEQRRLDEKKRKRADFIEAAKQSTKCKAVKEFWLHMLGESKKLVYSPDDSELVFTPQLLMKFSGRDQKSFSSDWFVTDQDVQVKFQITYAYKDVEKENPELHGTGSPDDDVLTDEAGNPITKVEKGEAVNS